MWGGSGSRSGAGSGELLGQPGRGLITPARAGCHLGAPAGHPLDRGAVLLGDVHADVVAPHQLVVDDRVLLGADQLDEQGVDLADEGGMHVLDPHDRDGDLPRVLALEVDRLLGCRLDGAVEPLAVDLLLGHVAALVSR